jgi:small subunit ribosomal protein S9
LNRRKVAKKKQQQNNIKYYEAVGRRRTATARVRLYPIAKTKKEVVIWDYKLSPGVIIVNRKPVKEKFPGKVFENKYIEPFRTTNTMNKFAATVLVSGSGRVGQLEAMVHGIARALEKADREKYRPILKKKGFLTRDPRMRERRKAGLAQSARAKKQSPKR